MKKNNSTQILITKKDTIIQKQDIGFSLKDEKVDTIKNDVSNLKNKVSTYPNSLFNTKLIGLAIKDSLATNPYKKYWIDFGSYCYSPALSFFIDTAKNKMYAVEYTFKNEPIKKEEIIFQLDIKKIVTDNENYQIRLNKIEQYRFEDHPKNEVIKTVFNFIKLDTVFKLEIKNKLPFQYYEVDRYTIFVNKKEESKFEHEGCGDFDG